MFWDRLSVIPNKRDDKMRIYKELKDDKAIQELQNQNIKQKLVMYAHGGQVPVPLPQELIDKKKKNFDYVDLNTSTESEKKSSTHEDSYE